MLAATLSPGATEMPVGLLQEVESLLSVSLNLASSRVAELTIKVLDPAVAYAVLRVDTQQLRVLDPGVAYARRVIDGKTIKSTSDVQAQVQVGPLGQTVVRFIPK